MKLLTFLKGFALFVAITFFLVTDGLAFNIKGRLIYSPDQQLTSNVPLVVLKVNEPSADQPPMFPVGRTNTDENGYYFFEGIDFPAGTKFQLGALVAGNRIGSAEFFYNGGLELEFDFDIADQLNLTPSANLSNDFKTATVQGKILGNQAAVLPGDSVFLQKFTLDDEGGVVSDVLSEVNLREDLSFSFTDVQFNERFAFKVGVYYKDLPVLSNLFSIIDKTKLVDIFVPRIQSIQTGFDDGLSIKRDAFLISLHDDGFLVSQFIYFFNRIDAILELSQPIFKYLPSDFYELSSSDINSGHLSVEGDKLIFTGPFLPGERIIFLQYKIKNKFRFGSYDFSFLDNVESLEFINSSKELSLDIKNFSTASKPVDIAGQTDYVSNTIDLTTAAATDNKVSVRLSSKFWPTYLLNYFLIFLVGLVILCSFIIYFWRRKKSPPLV